MKSCGDCRTENDSLEILCSACGSPLDTKIYLRCIYATSVLALAGVATLRVLQLVDRFSIPLAFELEVAALLVVYPLIKLWTKLRQPSRRVGREMGSVFSPRYDRALVTALLVFVSLIWFGALRIEGLQGPLDSRLTHAKHALDLLVTVGGLAAVAAMIRDQGPRFFDFRVANTYADRPD